MVRGSKSTLIALLAIAIAANQTDPPPPERGSGRRDYVEEIAYIKNC